MLRSASRQEGTLLTSTRPTTTLIIVSTRRGMVSPFSRNYLQTNQPKGTLKVHHIVAPFPRSLSGKFHILFAHARQLHLTGHLLRPESPTYDIYFVDQLSTCIPFLRIFGKTRVVFYGHFPDKLLAYGVFVEGCAMRRQGGVLKRIYRYPMDWLEEITTRTIQFLLTICELIPWCSQDRPTSFLPIHSSQPAFLEPISALSDNPCALFTLESISLPTSRMLTPATPISLR
jgi:hypothetical protein